VSKIIRQLIDKSLISVLVSKDDGRQRKYTLTGKGKRVMDELRAQREQAIDAIWLQLGRDQVLAFTSIGDDIATRLEGYLQRVGSRDTRTKRK
jgi:DNA-binding MarR family transcriptional regulator